jgi:DNA invertase Pin-like site-specific DNA recombinase
VRVTPDQRRRAVTMLDKFTTTEVAELFGVYRGTVARWAQKAGCPVPPTSIQRMRIRKSPDELHALHRRFKSWRKVGEVLGVSDTTVWRAANRLRRVDVEPRR